jgi:nuclear pore complex protein Nup98-Nup96
VSTVCQTSSIALLTMIRFSASPSYSMVEVVVPASQLDFNVRDTSGCCHDLLLTSSCSLQETRVQKLLDIQYVNSTVEIFDDVPAFSPKDTLRFRDFFPAIRDQNSHTTRLWELGHALFDELSIELPADVTAIQHQLLEESLRKIALSTWLEKHARPSVERDLAAAQQGPERVFSLLTGHQVDRAAEASAQGGDIRLAVLVAQADGTQPFREQMRAQLETWRAGNNDAHISKSYRRVYALLAGIVDVLEGVPDRDAVNASASVIVSEGLDWLRALALQLWYGSSTEAPIAVAVNTFQDRLKGPHPPAGPLLASGAEDALFKMITLYCDEDQSLDSLLQSDGLDVSPLDVSVQWHLYNVVARSLGIRDVADRTDNGSNTADKLTNDYAAQLEAVGLWQQAVFVSLHFETPEWSVVCHIKLSMTSHIRSFHSSSSAALKP